MLRSLPVRNVAWSWVWLWTVVELWVFWIQLSHTSNCIWVGWPRDTVRQVSLDAGHAAEWYRVEWEERYGCMELSAACHTGVLCNVVTAHHRPVSTNFPHIFDESSTFLFSSQFESRSGHWLSWLKFLVVFLSLSRQIPGEYLDYTMSASCQILSNSSLTVEVTESGFWTAS
jgi:hypothetical protein